MSALFLEKPLEPGLNSFHEKAGMSQVCFSVFSLFLPVRMFLFFSSSL
jgi:hypothetical protein